MVRPRDHEKYHALFGNMLPQELAAMLTEVWISPDYYLVAVPRHKTVVKGKHKRRYCTDCEAEVLKFIPKTHRGE